MFKETNHQGGQISLKMPLLSSASLSPCLTDPVCFVAWFLNLGVFVFETGPPAFGYQIGGWDTGGWWKGHRWWWGDTMNLHPCSGVLSIRAPCRWEALSKGAAVTHPSEHLSLWGGRPFTFEAALSWKESFREKSREWQIRQPDQTSQS